MSIEMFMMLMTMFSMAACILTLILTYEWKIRIERKYNADEQECYQTKQVVDDLDTSLFHVKEDLLELKTTFYKSGVEFLKVQADGHDKDIESIRKDLLDLQVISGTLPSKAGTMLEEVMNTEESLKAVQSKYQEVQAVVDSIKEKIEGLARAYGGLHFTSEEMENIRGRLEEIERSSNARQGDNS